MFKIVFMGIKFLTTEKFYKTPMMPEWCDFIACNEHFGDTNIEAYVYLRYISKS